MTNNNARLKAELRIAEALKSGQTRLDLRSIGLTVLPETIGQLTKLQHLELGRDYSKDEKQNRLTRLPESLGRLTQLRSLNASQNQLTSLPDSLGQLIHLESLDVSRNALKSLPVSLAQLTQLRSLNIASNELKSLPELLSQLPQLQSLNVSDNKLKSLSEWLLRLTQLHSLDISNNELKSLPEWLGHLTQLKSIDASMNQLTKLPESIGHLTGLQILLLYMNQLTELPDSLSNLSALSELSISCNGFKEIPPSVLNLKNLKYLYAIKNNIQNIPVEISRLNQLERLELGGGDIATYIEYADPKGHGNKIESLPISIIQLTKLKKLGLDDNPLNPAIQSAYGAGLDGLRSYLGSLQQNAEPLYEAKLVLVGEGNVGKTTLLKALKGKEDEAPKVGEGTTHGVEIDIHGLLLQHPKKEGVAIQLNAWDFGGQDVYRVTHQFFFSRRSLYILVWQPRNNVSQGQVEDWLNMIRLRVGDDARVIIVSTHCKSGGHLARIDQPVLMQRYGGMIVAFHEVDSLVQDESTGKRVGIAELEKIIAQEAAKLGQMGMPFNRNWKAARDELIAYTEPHISYRKFSEICSGYSLSQLDTDTLAHLMHDLGYIVHYGDDERLRDDVVLHPQWLSKAIGFVLEDEGTKENDGILPDKRLHLVWQDHHFENEPRYAPPLYPFFLRLMEKYDVSYRLPEDRHASLVAQHVPQVRPELPWLPEQVVPEFQRRIAMICSMEEEPPGLVPWMIVRTHDYAVEQNCHRLHWEKGMFLCHQPHGEAMLEKRGREFHVYAQAKWPEYFMNVLQHTLQKLITDNWPGMAGRYRFAVPCPEIIMNQPCKGRFNIHALRQWLAEGDATTRCPECSKRLSIAELLFGFTERSTDAQLREINEKLDGMDSRIANYFMATMRAIAEEAKHGPRLFTFRTREVGVLKRPLFSYPMELQLWCEAEGCQHPVAEKDKGLYPIDQPAEWVAKIAPYANFIIKVLSTVASTAAPGINAFFGAKSTEAWEIQDQLELTKGIIEKFPQVKTPDLNLPPGKILNEVERSAILALHNLLRELDPMQERLGLHRVATYTGDYRWLCKEHYDAWQPNIPEVIQPGE